VLNWQLIRHVCVTGSSMLRAYCCLHLFIESNFICDMFCKISLVSRPVWRLIMTEALVVDTCKMGTRSMLIWLCKKVQRIHFRGRYRNYYVSKGLSRHPSYSYKRVLYLQVKAIPLQAWTGPEGSRSLRLPNFKTVGT